MAIRPLAPPDTPWMAGLMERRRAEYEVYSPVFWRRAHGVEGRHAAFLARVIEQPDTIGLRSDNGFITATRTVEMYYVDDFAVEANGTWATDGRSLLLAAWAEARRRAASALRVVTAKRDGPKVAMLTAAGLVRSEQLWVKPLDVDAPGTVYSGRKEGRGYNVVLTAAPPVYDPGGPVAMITRFSGATLDDAEGWAADQGAVLAILPVEAAQPEQEPVASGSGYEVASQFYVGTPT